MKMKKLVAMLCAAAMLLSTAALPAAAADGAEDPAAHDYIFYDDFESGSLGGWVFGATTASTSQYSYGVEAVDGVNAMMLQTTANLDGATPNMFRDFEDVEYVEGNKIVVKARVKITGNTNQNRVHLKLNRPNITSFGGNESGYNWYTVATLRGTDIQTNGETDHSVGRVMAAADFSNKWVDMELVIDGIKKEAYVSASVDGQSYGPQTGTINDISKNVSSTLGGAYTAAGVSETTGFTSFNSLTWVFRFAPHTLYVDYMYAYEIKNVTAELESNVIYPDGDILLSVNYDIPVEAIKLVDADGSIAAATVTCSGGEITINPESELAEETIYRVVLDEDVLEANDFTTSTPQVQVPISKEVPIAENARVSGRLIPGKEISAEYDFYFKEAEGASTFEWYTSDSADGVWTLLEGESGKALTVTEEIAPKYVKFKVTPVGASGLAGTPKESSVLLPEAAPVAENIALSTTSLFVNSNISVSYSYSDINGDAEAESEIVWYAFNEDTGEWEEVYTGKAFKITPECEGRQIKCSVVPVSEGEYLNRGALYESAAYGPVQSAETLLSLTNLFVNPGLEDGVLEPWVRTNELDRYKGIELYTDETYNGSYALRTYPRIVNANDGWYQAVTRESGKRYILSAMVKKVPSTANISGFEGYSWNGGFTRVDRTADYMAPTDKWQRITTGLDSDTSGEANLGFLSFSTLNAEVIMDDFYFGEIIISDIGNKELEPVAIPESGSVRVAVTDGKIYNQLGTVNGFQDQSVTVRVPSSSPGITVSGNDIVIDSFALAGKHRIELCVEPTYAGATGSYTEVVELELVAGTQKPKARNVAISGSVAAGSTLTGTYDFYQADGKANASEVSWMYADTENGSYREIPGADSLTYVVEPQYADMFICLKVVPKTADGEVGDTVYSNMLTKPRVPVAEKVNVSGDFKVGGSITGAYTYHDPNGDAEGASALKWLISDSADGAYTQIAGETSSTLVLTQDMTDKYIKFAVTPVSTVSPETGEEVQSAAVKGPSAPMVYDVEITREDGRLTGSYKYYHEHNAKERGTVLEWYVDGILVSTGASYVISFTGTKTVKFSVTPVADTNPSTGKTVSVAAVLSGLSSSSAGTTGSVAVVGGGGAGGGGGGGASGGGGSAGGVTSINNMTLTDPNAAAGTGTDAASDISGHWGEEYIKSMSALGVMEPDGDGNYQPDELATREEMVTYLFRALGLEPTEYTGIFEDVEAGEFANILQTMVDNGIIAADTSFRPGDTITRQEMCKILYVALKNEGLIEDTQELLIAGFADFGSISEWAIDYVNGIYAKRIMVGVSDTLFGPKGTVTNAQAATMLTRLLKLIGGEEN